MTLTQFIDLSFRKILVPLNNLRLKRNPREDFFITELKKRASKIVINKNTQFASNQWLSNIIKFKNYILTQDPKNLLQWDIIRKTMFIGNAIFVIPEFIYLRRNNWSKWKKAIVEKKYFYTEPYLMYPKSSGNLIHCAYHLAKFENTNGKNVKNFDFIFEYGGGYGGLCLLIHNLGFKGKYIIYDFPILCALQSFFLKMNRVKKGVFCLDEINQVKKMVPKKGKRLFIATWSLSESPLHIRKKIYPIIKEFDAFLIGYQGQFGGVDNYKYFNDFKKKLAKYHWWSQKIIQLDGNYYLFGIK